MKEGQEGVWEEKIHTGMLAQQLPFGPRPPRASGELFYFALRFAPTVAAIAAFDRHRPPQTISTATKMS